jgi:hypothetical protein
LISFQFRLSQSSKFSFLFSHKHTLSLSLYHGGHNSWSGRYSHLSDSYSVHDLFFRFVGGLPLHKVHFLIFRNPLDIPFARFTNSSPKALLSNSLFVLSLLRRSYHLVRGSFIPVYLETAVWSHGTLRHFCIPGPSKVYSHPFFLSGFAVQCRLFLVSITRVPCLVPILLSGLSLFWRWPTPCAVHNFPRSEIF